MKPILEKINKPEDSVFSCFEFTGKQFQCPYHFHSEYEITLIVEGVGQRLVGDKLQGYSPGDLVFYGVKLPHMYQNFERGIAHSRYIQFRSELFNEIFKITESHLITQMLKKSAQGITFSKADRLKIIPLFNAIFEKPKGVPQLCGLLTLLDVMSRMAKPHFIVSRSYTQVSSSKGMDKLQKMIHYISEHYSDQITLSQISKIGHLHPQSVSRFFVQHLGKSFQEFLIETRLTRVVRELLESRKGISEIAYECGFNNLSNFNRQFLNYYKKQPSHYRKCQSKGYLF